MNKIEKEEIDNSKIEKKDNLGLTYEEFVNRLNESQKTVLFLKEYIESKGLRAYAPELVVTPNAESRGDYSDEVDLVFWRKNGNEVRVEVKQFSIDFTTKNFRYNEIIVNSLPGYETKKIKPDLHIILSKNKEYAAVIDNSNIDKWELRQAFDKVKKRDLYFYFLKKEYINFIQL